MSQLAGRERIRKGLAKPNFPAALGGLRSSPDRLFDVGLLSDRPASGSDTLSFIRESFRLIHARGDKKRSEQPESSSSGTILSQLSAVLYSFTLPLSSRKLGLLSLTRVTM